MTIAHHAALNRALATVEARLKALDAPAPDAHGDDADRLTAHAEHEGQVLSRAALLERQRLIRWALVKIDRAEYGLCEACGQPIATKRLSVIPWAARCLLCESRAEQAAARPVEPPVDDEGQ